MQAQTVPIVSSSFFARPAVNPNMTHRRPDDNETMGTPNRVGQVSRQDAIAIFLDFLQTMTEAVSADTGGGPKAMPMRAGEKPNQARDAPKQPRWLHYCFPSTSARCGTRSLDRKDTVDELESRINLLAHLCYSITCTLEDVCHCTLQCFCDKKGRNDAKSETQTN